MQTSEKGVFPSSKIFFPTPSSLAREFFYYITRCGHYFCNNRYSFTSESEVGKDESRKTMLLFFIRSGSISMQFEGNISTARKGQLIIIDCLKPHKYWANEDTEFLWLHLDGNNTREFFTKIVSERGHIFSAVKSNSLYQDMLEIVSSCEFTIGSPDIVRSQIIYHLLCLLFMPNSSQSIDGNQDSIIGKSLRYIETHLYEPLSVEQIAASAGMSTSHFSRLFRAETGNSPHEYIILKRIDAAQGLLYTSSLSIREIALQIGYNSESNFIVSFKKNVGVSPSRFRKLTKTVRTPTLKL